MIGTPFRTSYWHIEPVWIFYVLAALAVLVFVYGLVTRLSVWLKGVKHQKIPFSREGIRDLVLDGLLGWRIFRGDVAAGTMHLLILWGFLALFVGTVLISADYWLGHFLRGLLYLWYSACLEVAGLMLVAGVAWAMIRRYLQRVPRLERRAEDLLVVLWLLVVGVTGFAVEGGRLAAQRPDWAGWSFAGHWVSFLWPNSNGALSAYPYLWWTHALLSLGFIAYIPFCKLFHVLAAPASIYLHNQPLQVVSVEGRGEEDVFTYRDMVSFDACTRCGRCVEVCPATGAGEPFSPRDFIAWARVNLRAKVDPLNRFGGINDPSDGKALSAGDFKTQRIWHCTTCRACLEVCPVYVSTLDAIRQVRSGVVEAGTEVPTLLSQSLKNLYKYNNPWEATKKKRAKWSGEIEIPDLTKKGEAKDLCYFVGCTTSMDTRAQDLARAFVRILNHGDVDFGTLGKKEPCCGDIARRCGEDGLFEMKMDDCLDLFGKHEICEVVTSSPHCFHSFHNEYPAYQALKDPEERISFRARHYTAFLNELLVKGVLTFDKPLPVKVTYHDPCYLGRHNRIFDVPREIIRAIPGIKLVEMNHNREDSLCCGGGGDRMWQEDMDGDPKMSEIRIWEAAATGADMVITTCPLCLIMLEDARKTAGLEDTLKVMDLNELVLLALGLDRAMDKDEERQEKKISGGG
ncbi:MAG: heterodisulfide reductase-related iron-sulfur binding cluster [Thermodesulfobacteriota bacterium]|nr:heterodisulfide reductase-related iron-sulfur binding cluster [Thermodesulfobacteriota bacterium]